MYLEISTVEKQTIFLYIWKCSRQTEHNVFFVIFKCSWICVNSNAIKILQNVDFGGVSSNQTLLIEICCVWHLLYLHAIVFASGVGGHLHSFKWKYVILSSFWLFNFCFYSFPAVQSLICITCICFEVQITNLSSLEYFVFQLTFLDL